MADRTFDRAERGKYTSEEKDALGKLCKKCKLESDEKLNMGQFYKDFPALRGLRKKIEDYIYSWLSNYQTLEKSSIFGIVKQTP